ncbi:MAG: tRNA 2-thiouridine(34) synthase MnmA [Anaerolineales bacterium]
MSGGVDSSVAAALLTQQGYRVIGMMLRLWSEPGREDSNRCCTPDAMALARRVAAHLGIPFYAVDARTTFRETIVQRFLDGYAQGITPNPCLYCNRHIRFGLLLQRALDLGADFLATGHYVQLTRAEDGGVTLRRGVDPAKDQSYVLGLVQPQKLARALFPVGGYPKAEVRQLARDFRLPVAERADSQDLCFLAGDDYRNFLQRNAPEMLTPGKIINRAGQVIGEHSGLPNYTIGQRKGLNVPSSVPLYVLGKNPVENALIVGTADELGTRSLRAGDASWVAGQPPAPVFRAGVQIRYKARPIPATVQILSETSFKIEFDEPLRDITPGQAAVCYDGEVCLGGGVIEV